MENLNKPNPQSGVNENYTNPNLSKNKGWTESYDQKMATTFLIVAIVSLFIIPFMAYGSISMGCLGLYSSFKNKLGSKAIATNIAAIIIGILSLVMKQMSVY
jgi:hypothetical protein